MYVCLRLCIQIIYLHLFSVHFFHSFFHLFIYLFIYLFILKFKVRDVSTDIPSEDLFDFDFEVTPILDVLVGRTIWLAKIELNNELELEELNRKTREFEVKHASINYISNTAYCYY